MTRSKSPCCASIGWKIPLTQQLAGIVAASSSGKPSDNAAVIWLCHDHEWSDTIFCVMTTSGLTRLCGSISGYVSNSRSPALAFIVLCSVVKERCGHIKRQHTDTRLPVKAMRRCRSQSALRKQRLRAKGHPTGAKGTATTFQPLLIAKY